MDGDRKLFVKDGREFFREIVMCYNLIGVIFCFEEVRLS